MVIFASLGEADLEELFEVKDTTKLKSDDLQFSFCVQAIFDGKLYIQHGAQLFKVVELETEFWAVLDEFTPLQFVHIPSHLLHLVTTLVTQCLDDLDELVLLHDVAVLGEDVEDVSIDDLFVLESLGQDRHDLKV